MKIAIYQKALRHIEAHPELWNQENWCGTACCIAGHIVKNEGYNAESLGGHTPYIVTMLLKIETKEAAYIFSPLNTLEDLQEIETFYLDNPSGRNRKGYNIIGFDLEGYDKSGHDSEGYNTEGFDIAGYNRLGFNRNGFNRQGYDHIGFHKDHPHITS